MNQKFTGRFVKMVLKKSRFAVVLGRLQSDLTRILFAIFHVWEVTKCWKKIQEGQSLFQFFDSSRKSNVYTFRSFDIVEDLQNQTLKVSQFPVEEATERIPNSPY